MGVLMESRYFDVWLRHADLRDGTKRSYVTGLKKFEAYLEQCGMEGEVDFDKFFLDQSTEEYFPMDSEFMDEFVDHLLNSGVSVHTIYTTIEALKSFMKFLRVYKLIQRNPISCYENHFYKRHVRDRALSQEECKKMLAAAISLDPFFRQYYTLILLLLVCGLRKEELLQLRASEIDFERGIIRIVRGQKTYADTVDMPSGLKDELHRYLHHQLWNHWCDGKDKPVFFDRMKNRPLNYDGLRAIIDNIKSRAGISRKITPHDFRYTMAQLMYRAGVDPVIIQRQLRHARLGTTLIYLQSGIELETIIRNHREIRLNRMRSDVNLGY